MKIICQIYRSTKDSGMYLYCKKEEGLSKVPEALMNRFGRAEPAMVLMLDEKRKLANADITKVMAALQEAGYFLQLPPATIASEEAQAVAVKNSKLY
ncbi:YcgL domain-containing protein [Gilvimarinus agarilyticus]|uniref:YcgL domain-containing protein n=1 Tax=unclassified Gilvimarinus TaxID=2642066 RepID=UPI001C0A1F59|nr:MULTISPECIES: YcgL domain-containing protein [unclassified Gilvimarinus]MBU2885942.1 YcgL domain-containing protein [Gilvimarinus agarilyticus]MDO6570688.1 YcgL domain-containing protein [Gilvimarinus sp. 2_MG-2023]MDO6747719.1 YcgL domain-containing protein [Gilvimarinus sp. 1_MG-2023]